MKKRILLVSLMGFCLLVVSACSSNEVGVTEYNAKPDETVISIESNQETPPESESVSFESVEEIISTEVIEESSAELLSVESLEQEEEETEIPVESDLEPAFETQNYTHHDVENATIEDERIQQALSKTINYLKVNNQFYDTAEYHFQVSEGSETKAFIIEVSQRRADGLEIIGRYAYDYAANTLDPYYK